MKRLSIVRSISLFILALATVAGAQQTPVADANGESYGLGIYYAGNFAKWQLSIAPGSSITATGSQTFLANAASVSTPDGITFVPFVVGGVINVGTGANLDQVTISGVSGCTPGVALPGSSPTCSITATSFANTHYAGEPVSSGDNGIYEAINFVSYTGGGTVRFMVDCGQVTLSTTGLTTTAGCYVPKQFYGQGASAYVSTAITTSTNWAVGISGSTSAFCSVNSTLTKGATCLANQAAPALVGSTIGVTNLLITVTGSDAGAGVVHPKVWGYAPVQSAY